MDYVSFTNVGFPFFNIGGSIGFPSLSTMEVNLDITFSEWDGIFQQMLVNNVRLYTEFQKAFIPLLVGATERNRDHLKLICVDGRYVGN